jgi:hypothetical protein
VDGFGADRSTPPDSERERRVSGCERADRQGPPVREGQCAGADARAVWAGWADLGRNEIF